MISRRNFVAASTAMMAGAIYSSAGTTDRLAELENRIARHDLKDISKDDVFKLFLSHVHPSSTTRAKLSVHMHSQKPPKRISTEAAQAFASLTREAGHKVPDEDWMEIMGADGTAAPEEFSRHWAGLLGGVDKAKSLFASLPALVQRYPVEGEGEDTVQPDARYIQDLETFKLGQPVAIHHGPCVEWGDLPISRL